MEPKLTQSEVKAKRQVEYETLKMQLEETPLALDDVETRLIARLAKEKRKWQHFIAIPTGSLVGVMLLFVILVNGVPTFARTMGNIPILRDIAKLVAWSPSLVAAIENDFVQIIEQSQTADDIKAHIAYLIVDQKQVNIFYSLSSDKYKNLEATAKIFSSDATTLQGYVLSSGYGVENERLRHITIEFVEEDVPSELRLELRIHDNGSGEVNEPVELFVEDNDWDNLVFEEPEVITTLQFDLAFNPYFTAQGEQIPLNTAFQLDEQRFVLEEASIYPTHMRFKLEDDSQNTAYLVGMQYYIVNEKGEVFDRVTNGIVASGKEDSPMMASYYLESAFFSESSALTLYITEVDWLDKAHERVLIDLQTLQAGYLPQGVELVAAEAKSWGWEVVFSGSTYDTNKCYGLWSPTYYDEAGNEYYINSQSSSSGYWDEITGEDLGEANKFYNTIPLKGFTENKVYMVPAFTRKVVLEEPVVLRIK